MSALAFMTIFGRSRTPHARTLWWLPLVGAMVGAAVAGTHWVTHQLWPPMVAGAVVVAVDLVITGALHLDGLADTADGVLPHLDRPRRLAVMAEPGIGAFAVAVVVTVLMTRWALLADAGLDPVALVAIWAMSRTMVAIIPAVVPYARPDGLASAFLAGSSPWLSLWLVPAGATLIVTHGFNGAAAAFAAVVTAVGLVVLAKRRLGGFTGDILGASILVSETAALLALAAQP